MAIEVFQGGSIPRELSSGAMEFLWAKWKALNATNALSLQRLTEESAHSLRSNSTYMISAGDDFVFMYMGDAVQAAAGFNPTGQLLSASDSPVAHDLLSVYRQVAKTLAPCFVRFTGPRNGRQIWQGLVLPIKLAPETVLLVCYSELISHHAEVGEHLFQASRDALLIASPITNEMGEVTDGWVVMMNDAARDFLDFRDSIGNLRLRHLQKLHGLELRFKLHPPVAPGTVTRVAACEDFEAEVVRFAHVFALRLTAQAGATKHLASEAAPELAPA
jgi:hypothetical protein